MDSNIFESILYCFQYMHGQYGFKTITLIFRDGEYSDGFSGLKNGKKMNNELKRW